MVLLWVVQATWGLPQTVAGLFVLACNARCPHARFKSACITAWPLRLGLSLGPFVFVPATSAAGTRRMLVHEYGHCVQSLVLGPLYVPLVGLPSLLWANVPAFSRWRRKHRVSYYDAPFEWWASWLGERVCHEPALW